VWEKCTIKCYIIRILHNRLCNEKRQVLVELGIDKYLQDDFKKKNTIIWSTVPVKIKMGGAKMITGRHWLTVNLLTNKLVDSCGGCYEE
jgi:hypothetical protein